MAISRLFMKKKKKIESQNQKLKKFIGAEISAESAIIATGKVLVESMEVAKNKEDVDGLLAVADRWYNISRLILEQNSIEEYEKHPIGFVGGNNGTEQTDSGESDDKS